MPQELPKRKQVVTQERSKVIRETDNPFGDDEDELPAPAPPAPEPSSSRGPQLSTPATGQISSFSYLSSKDKGSKKKDKKSKKSGHRKFNLEAEKDQMKETIAESSIAATNLNNALQSINRERERISDNALAVSHFETCKQLRRKILRYVSLSCALTTGLVATSMKKCVEALLDPPRRIRTMAWQPTTRQRRAGHGPYDIRAARSFYRCGQ